MTQRFLGSTAEIRATLIEAISKAKSLDLAVAFVTPEWFELLGDFKKPCRVVCWLSSTNTNPHAVEQMMSEKNFRVRHLSAMHAKVYLAKGRTDIAIVGSANLSSTALSDNDISGNVEAAFELRGRGDLKAVAAWFNSLWKTSKEVDDSDLDDAKRAYAKRPKGGGKGKGVKKAKAKQTQLPEKWNAPKKLLKLANSVRGMSLSDLREEANGWRVIHTLKPESMSKEDLKNIISVLVSWSRHAGAFKPIYSEPIGRVREAFCVAFDQSRSLRERFELLNTSHKVKGLGLTAWSMILYWYKPHLYSPFNVRTKKFLRDMKLTDAPQTINPSSYEGWTAMCRALAAMLRLATPGHVDRMVWAYTKYMTNPDLLS